MHSVKNLLYIFKILLLFDLTFFYEWYLYTMSLAAPELQASQCPSKGRVPCGSRVTPALNCHPNILLFLSFIDRLSPNQKYTQVCHLEISFLDSIVEWFLVYKILMCKETKSTD
jgi:hypothetical protein